MVKLTHLLVFAVLVVGITGTFPSMDVFMQQMMSHIDRMESMNRAMLDDGMRRLRAERRFAASFGPGGTRFRTADGGTGFVYNSPDGSSSTYSFHSGDPSHGYTFSSGSSRSFGHSYGSRGSFRREW